MSALEQSEKLSPVLYLLAFNHIGVGFFVIRTKLPRSGG